MRSDKGLYIHVPFCRKKCPYCDFYSVVIREEFSEKYADAVIRNIRHYGGRFDTVYFGGGTPILLYKEIPRILAEVDFEENAEITVECCPNEMNEIALKTLREAGVNRLSVGIQSLCDEELAVLGRTHSAKEAENSVLLAKNAGFENISADLMLAVPKQTKNSLRKSVEGISKLGVTHVSAYLLKIEPNTVFGKKTPAGLPDEDETAEFYLLAVEELEKHGFHQYEISSFARDGKFSRHNLKYWKRDEYLGIGPAAHSFRNGKRFFVERNLREFLENSTQKTTVEDDNVNEDEEKIMLGLRLTEGVELNEKIEKALKRIPRRFYRVENGRLSLTPEGFLVSNSIIAEILENLNIL